ncbi:MAG: NAD-dependent epimerase/dehydratase family protein [Gammaproteobacteria bacterium]|nr:NAD-dependent epimerase/dehydratase family protein [Gammaproteobacteria bacterium]MBU2239957.1 NAD-dependent epimerase/dehydratase family protein [Gammaproteobacteria bacterium]MBU2320534.1 NAD-dependent epimerase/dehydratase family protein [Gammaproteobacteria bacterium]MBU2412767.1 NAD-dependent epimerase/dehydratase family protein [Gammaproteobacteria bacterium]
MKTLVTGAAGFIGSHICRRLCADGYDVVGVDNLNDYYDVDLKKARLEWVGDVGFKFHYMSVENSDELTRLFDEEQFDCVIHLAGQAGVRYSSEDPMVYGESNLMGFLSVLEACRCFKIKHLVYASSSSVYGLNDKIPFSVNDNVDHPVSLYAATKKANELMAHSYSQMYGLPTTGLRFFSVYGPWSRPDMAFYKFTEAMIEKRPIDVFNHGELYRDFTYIDDVVEAVVRVTKKIPNKNQEWTKANKTIAQSSAPYQIFNVGSGAPVKLTKMIDLLECKLGVRAIRQLKPMQVGEVNMTYSDAKELFDEIGFSPQVSFTEGVAAFVEWYNYYRLNSQQRFKSAAEPI